MKVVAFNGSPRKNWNTAKLLEAALGGAGLAGAETKLYHLYDYTFRGCISCMRCKQLENRSSLCVMRDTLTPLLEELDSADALIFGSPIYFGATTGMMRSFLERALFPYLIYGPECTHFPRKLKSAFIYTMNVNDETLAQSGYMTDIENIRWTMERTFGDTSETLFVTDTRQVTDYSKYDIRMFDTAAKVQRDETHFPLELDRARELGQRLVTP